MKRMGWRRKRSRRRKSRTIRGHRSAPATAPQRFLKSPVDNWRGTCICTDLHRVGKCFSLTAAVWPCLSLTTVLTPPGNRGKSIRTENSWLTPVEFLEKALGRLDGSHWKKDIECDGQPLKVKIEVAGSLLTYPVCSNCVAIASFHG